MVNLKDARKGLLQYLKSKLKEVSSVHDQAIAGEITDRINTEILEARQLLYDTVQRIFEDMSEAISNYGVHTGMQKEEMKDGEITFRITASFVSTDLWRDVIESQFRKLSADIRKFVFLLTSLLEEMAEFSKNHKKSYRLF